MVPRMVSRIIKNTPLSEFINLDNPLFISKFSSIELEATNETKTKLWSR